MTLSADQLADRLVARLVERGDVCAPCIMPDGQIAIPAASTVKEAMWAQTNPDAMRGALVRAKRYTPGTLAKAYGFEEPK